MRKAERRVPASFSRSQRSRGEARPEGAQAGRQGVKTQHGEGAGQDGEREGPGDVVTATNAAPAGSGQGQDEQGAVGDGAEVAQTDCYPQQEEREHLRTDLSVAQQAVASRSRPLGKNQYWGLRP